MKKQVRKITLSKETLVKLSDSQSFAVVGGSGSNCGNITCVQDCGRSGLETC
ncbi:MAG TPA: class I lanthipeptide [Thermoanaerobaculia bacterium]|nr:class I lanthipeptide [Thermoanaerobaculia bacterium]